MTAPRGLSLVELLVSLAILAAIGLASAGLLRAASAAGERRLGATETVVARSILADRLSAESLACPRALAVENDLLTLWRGEIRRNGLVDASELVFVRPDRVAGTVTVETWLHPDGDSPKTRALEPALPIERAADAAALREIHAGLVGAGWLARRVIAEDAGDLAATGTPERPALRIRFASADSAVEIPVPLGSLPEGELP
jgi:prepilin-type N-terminal cleavage/methylation domain-containing protein